MFRRRLQLKICLILSSLKHSLLNHFWILVTVELAGSEVVTRPLAGIESRAGAFIENLYSWIKMELKQKTQQVKHLPRGSIDDHM